MDPPVSFQNKGLKVTPTNLVHILYFTTSESQGAVRSCKEAIVASSSCKEHTISTETHESLGAIDSCRRPEALSTARIIAEQP